MHDPQFRRFEDSPTDGNRVKSVLNGETVIYVGNLYEKKVVGSTTTHIKYYYFGGRRIAIRPAYHMRPAGTLSWLLGDHLGSTTMTADGATGARTAELWYKPWGEPRDAAFGVTPTARRFTGQVLDGVAGGLYFYDARYYDPALGRFTQADTIVPNPGNPQALNRYSYSANNPLRFIDPSGHKECEGAMNCDGPDPALPPAAPPAPPVPTPSPVCTPFVTPSYQGPFYRAEPQYAPDDGWILKYHVYGDVDLRLEYVHVSSYASRGTLPVAVAGEYRTVTVFDDGDVIRVYDEVSLSGTVGEALYFGQEWTPTGGRQTTAGLAFAGADLQLQSNQAMIGIVNPAGVGGGRIGAQFSAPGVRVLATSQAYLVESGGADRLGRDTIGKDAVLDWAKWIPGSNVNGVWVSGAQRAAAWANQWPVRVVP